MRVCHLDSSAVIWLSCPLLARSRFLLGKTGNWGHSRSWLTECGSCCGYNIHTVDEWNDVPVGNLPEGALLLATWQVYCCLMERSSVSACFVLSPGAHDSNYSPGHACLWVTNSPEQCNGLCCVFICVLCVRANRHIYRLLLLNTNYAETWVVCFRCTLFHPRSGHVKASNQQKSCFCLTV